MQLLGEWMISTPRERAALSHWSIRGAISLSRRVAFRLWWRSHMSQTMIAVAFGSQVSDFTTARYPPAAPGSSTRERSWSTRRSSPATAAIDAWLAIPKRSAIDKAVGCRRPVSRIGRIIVRGPFDNKGSPSEHCDSLVDGEGRGESLNSWASLMITGRLLRREG